MLVHFSTDFVFDGRSEAPYTEEDAPNSLSVYGASKLAGEQEVRKAPRHYVLRVESLFGGAGTNGHRATVDFMAARMADGQVVSAAVDRTVTPTYVLDAARATRALIEGSAPSGLYHCVNSGSTTWYELAREIARILSHPAHIAPLLSADMKGAAARPQFCALSNRKLVNVGVEMPSWQSALAQHFTDLRRLSASTAPAAGLGAPARP